MTPVAKSLLPSQRVPTRKLSQRCGTKTKPGRPNKLVKPWLIGHLRCTVAQGQLLSLSQLFAAEPVPGGRDYPYAEWERSNVTLVSGRSGGRGCFWLFNFVSSIGPVSCPECGAALSRTYGSIEFAIRHS